ncbi:MAG: hypothetical protein PHV66_07400 [Bacteroidales bacterium]|nr:hypothetical protein [Bacteroidales bacterium]
MLGETWYGNNIYHAFLSHEMFNIDQNGKVNYSNEMLHEMLDEKV